MSQLNGCDILLSHVSMEESLTAEVGHRDLPTQAVEKAGLQGKVQELLVAVGPIQDSGCDFFSSPLTLFWNLVT